MKKQKLGIYLDSEGVGGAVVEGKDLVSAVFLPYSLVSEESSVEEVNKKIQTEALVKRVIDELGADVNQVQIAVSDKKTIFRYLTLPSMTTKELKLALPLEVEKYIPFKIENVVWNYTKASGLQRNKLRVAFLGMRRDVWEETVDIVKNLHMKMKSLESSSFSTLSTLVKLNYISKKEKNFVVFILSDTDGEITIFSDRFPYFSRHTKLPLTNEGKPDVSKIGDELRLTLDYYRREFGNKKLNKLLLVGSKENLQYYSFLSEKFGLEVENITLEDLLGKDISTVQELKAYCTALDNYKEKNLHIDLLEEEIKKKKEAQGDAEEGVVSVQDIEADVPWNFKPVVGVIIAGLLLAGGVFFLQAKKETPQVKEMGQVLEDLSQVYGNDLEKIKSGLITITDLEKEKNQLADKYEFYKKFDQIDISINPVLSFILDGVNKGMWFEEINLKRTKDLTDYTLSLQGYVYLGDTQKESESLNSFISYLKNSDLLNEEGKEVELSFVRKRTVQEYNVTSFKLDIE